MNDGARVSSPVRVEQIFSQLQAGASCSSGEDARVSIEFKPYGILESMSTSDSPAASGAGLHSDQSNDPKSVKVDISGGTGLDIAWKDGHRSSYSFVFLRDACPCALCDDERDKVGRKPGEPPALPPGALPMFKEKARPSHAEPVGRYAIRFNWNDGHDLGIYSWPFLREHCPCEDCTSARKQ